jgi:hypothetical protein
MKPRAKDVATEMLQASAWAFGSASKPLSASIGWETKWKKGQRQSSLPAPHGDLDLPSRTSSFEWDTWSRAARALGGALTTKALRLSRHLRLHTGREIGGDNSQPRSHPGHTDMQCSGHQRACAALECLRNGISRHHYYQRDRHGLHNSSFCTCNDQEGPGVDCHGVLGVGQKHGG